MNRNRILLVVTILVVALASAPRGLAKDGPRAFFTPRAELKWTAGAIPGVSSAVVEGDMAKGPCRFYLKYAGGFVAPLHHHSPDHYVTTVSGNLVVVVDGKDHRVPAGSYFALLGKQAHAARCEGSEDCVMFIDAKGAWDVVPEK
jgi:mannose-6-phosphate isomerase-like protein (cupin superfamily)